MIPQINKEEAKLLDVVWKVILWLCTVALTVGGFVFSRVETKIKEVDSRLEGWIKELELLIKSLSEKFEDKFDTQSTAIADLKIQQAVNSETLKGYGEVIKQMQTSIMHAITNNTKAHSNLCDEIQSMNNNFCDEIQSMKTILHDRQ